jgi:hypothetical protein
MRGCALGSYIVRFHTSTNAKPSTPITANTHCQPNACTSQPISGANTTVAAYCAALKIADAVPRSAAGNHVETIRLLAGNDGASAAPTRKRSANSSLNAAAPPMKPIPPCSSVNSDQKKMLNA